MVDLCPGAMTGILLGRVGERIEGDRVTTFTLRAETSKLLSHLAPRSLVASL